MHENHQDLWSLFKSCSFRYTNRNKPNLPKCLNEDSDVSFQRKSYSLATPHFSVLEIYSAALLKHVNT